MEKFKAGNYLNQGSFKSFIPEEINRNWKLSDMEIIDLLSQADRQLGRLDMYSEHTPNIDLFISMHVIKEATKSRTSTSGKLARLTVTNMNLTLSLNCLAK